MSPAMTILTPPLSLTVASAARRPRRTATVKTDNKEKRVGFGGDTKETKWHCVEGCGACCKLQKGPSFPSPEEIFDDPSHVQDNLIYYITNQIGSDKLYKSLIGPDGWCIHYEKSTRKCSIYSERPYFCRVEPEVFKSLFQVKEKHFHKEACSSCRDTIKAIHGPNSKELYNFNISIRNSCS